MSTLITRRRCNHTTYVKHPRPACFGGMWLVGQAMEIIRIL